MPSQRSLNNITDEVPIAMQLVVLVHDTLFNDASGAEGPATIDQDVPFHRSISGLSTAEPPTAKQFVVLKHDTRQELDVEPAGFGLATSDQLVPFHADEV